MNDEERAMWMAAVEAGKKDEIEAWLTRGVPKYFLHFLVQAIEMQSKEMQAMFIKAIPAWQMETTSTDLSWPWHKALEVENLSALKALTEAGCSVDNPLSWRDPDFPGTEWKAPPLIYAILTGKLKAIDFLLEKNAKINVIGMRAGYDEDYEQLLPLYEAVRKNDLDLAKRLLERGADPNLPVRHESGSRYFYTSETFTALKIVPGGADDMAALLVSHGARYHKDGKDMTTEYLAGHGFKKALLAMGGDIPTLSGEGDNSVFPSKALGKPLKCSTPEQLLALGRGLHEAIRASSVETLKVLIGQGAPLDTPDEEGKTPLYLAASLNRDESAAILISEKADIAARDQDGNTLLHAAICFNRILSGPSTLLDLCQSGLGGQLEPEARRLVLVKRLIAAGVDLEAENKEGERVLHIAAQARATTLIKVFLGAGANPAAVDSHGFNALHHSFDAVTISPNGFGVLDYERSIPKEEETSIIEIYNLLIASGTSPHVFDKKNGATLLHYAAARGYQLVVEYLLNLGLDPAVRDKGGWTPRYWAIRNGWRSLGKFLIPFESRRNE